MKRTLLLLIPVLFLSLIYSQSVEVKDSDSNTLMQIDDEGITGSILLPSGSTPDPTTNKLYNEGGTLKWNGSALGTAGSADGDWTINSNDMYSAVSGNVGIGEPNPTIKLHVVQMEDASVGTFILGNTTSSEVALTAETNSNGNGGAFMAVAKGTDGNAGYFLIEDTNNQQVGLYSQTYGSGAAIRARTDGIGDGSSPGSGSGGWFSAMNPSNTAPALRGYTVGEGSAAVFRINKGANNSAGIYSETNGTGAAIEGTNNGGGVAGLFIQDNPTNPSPALRVSTVGDVGHAGYFESLSETNEDVALNVSTYGFGIAGNFKNENLNNNNPAIRGYTRGTGHAGSFEINHSGSGAHAIYAETIGSGNAVEGYNSGLGRAAFFHTDNSSNNSHAVEVHTNSVGGSGVDVVVHPGGMGHGIRVAIDETTNSNPAIFAETSGTGPAISANGTVQMTSFKMPTGVVDGHVLTTDGSGVGTWQTPHGGVDGDWTINSNDIYSAVSGNVGIGTATPAQKLHIAGTAQMTGFKMATGVVDGHVLTTDGDGVGSWKTPQSADNLGNHLATDDLDMAGFEINLNGGYLSGDGDDEGVFVDSDGNVGIGTSSPTTNLHIYGTQAGWGVEEELLLMELAGTYGGTKFVQYATSATDWGLKIRDFNDLDHFTINYETGNVGIGTTSPTELLDVDSDGIRIRTSQTPASSTADGYTGQITWDIDYMYVCTNGDGPGGATDTWKRSAISTW